MCWAFVYSETVRAFSPFRQLCALLAISSLHSRRCRAARYTTSEQPTLDSIPETARVLWPSHFLHNTAMKTNVSYTIRVKCKGSWASRALYDLKETFSLYLPSKRNDEDERMDWEVVSGDRLFSPPVTPEYGTFYNMSLHQRKSPSLSHPLSAPQFKAAAGNTKPLHVAHEISIIILQTCCTFTCCRSDQNSDAIYFKREKTPPNKWIIRYSLSSNPPGQACITGHIH